MTFIIEPYYKVGEIKLGMSREQVRILISSEPTIVHDLELRDIFHEIGLQVFYRNESPYFVQAVMLYKPAKASIISYDLLEEYSIKSLNDIFESLGFTVSVKTEGIEINDLGIFLSTQDYEIFGDEPPESVVAFVQGYYDHLSAS
jgi:hypothetical protein